MAFQRIFERKHRSRSTSGLTVTSPPCPLSKKVTCLSCLCYLFVERLFIYLFIGAWGEKLSFAVIRCAAVDANKLARATVRDDHRRRVCSSTKTLMARIAATSAIMSHRRNVRSCLRSCLRCPLQIEREQAECLSWRVCSKGGRGRGKVESR